MRRNAVKQAVSVSGNVVNVELDMLTTNAFEEDVRLTTWSVSSLRAFWNFSSSIMAPPPAAWAAEHCAAIWSNFIRRPVIATSVFTISESTFSVWPFRDSRMGLPLIGDDFGEPLTTLRDICGEQSSESGLLISADGSLEQTGGQSLYER